jgi:hypothetical protein
MELGITHSAVAIWYTLAGTARRLIRFKRENDDNHLFEGARMAGVPEFVVQTTSLCVLVVLGRDADGTGK